MLLAEATIFITVATTLATMDIAPVVGNGEVQLPEVKQTSGIITYVFSTFTVGCILILLP